MRSCETAEEVVRKWRLPDRSADIPSDSQLSITYKGPRYNLNTYHGNKDDDFGFRIFKK